MFLSEVQPGFLADDCIVLFSSMGRGANVSLENTWHASVPSMCCPRWWLSSWWTAWGPRFLLIQGGCQVLALTLCLCKLALHSICLHPVTDHDPGAAALMLAHLPESRICMLFCFHMPKFGCLLCLSAAGNGIIAVLSHAEWLQCCVDDCS